MLQVFSFDEATVRVITDEKGEPMFVAKDVCDILSISNVSDALTRLDEDEKLMSVLPIAGQNREVSIISESGMYSLVMTSRKPEAKKFKKWVTSEVLPSIRKTGSYSSKPMSNIEMMLLQANINVEIEKRQKALENKVIEVTDELKEIKAKILTTPDDYYTIIGYASLRGIHMGVREAANYGRKASKISKEEDLLVGKAHSEIFGEVNTYHVSILADVFKITDFKKAA